MLRYWWSVIVEANKITFSLLFGTALRLFIDALIFLSAVAVLHYWGKHTQVLDQIGWLEAVIVSAVVIYFPLTLFNVFRVPYLRTKQHLAELETYAGRSLNSEKPSFVMGIELNEVAEADVDEFEAKESWMSAGLFETQEVCRIWVENIHHEPVRDCRVVIEEIKPPTSIRIGARLIPDNRGEDAEARMLFDLSSTEKKFFKFVRLTSDFPNQKLVFAIETDRRPTGFSGVFKHSPLEFGQEYEITVAIHGASAGSSRLQLSVLPQDAKRITIRKLN
jgi:hypothetical protein